MRKDTKIFWSSQEEAQVGAEALRLRLLDPKLPWREIAKGSQKVLPELRRRPVYAGLISQIHKLCDLSQSKQEEAVVLPEPLPPPAQDDPVATLAETIGDAFAQLFAQALRSALERTKAHIERPPQVQPEERTRLPKVTIVGLLPQQQNLINQEFHQAFDLRFWKEGSVQVLKNLTQSSDAVLVMTDWVSHSYVRTIESVGGKEKLRLLKGTMGVLREYLRANQGGS